MAGAESRRVSVVGRLGVHPRFRLPLPGRRILAYLALHPLPLPRSLAAGELWPELTDQQARANLRRALWQLPRGWVDSVGDELVLQAEVDLPEVKALAGRALRGCTLDMDEIDVLSEGILPGWHEEWVLSHQDTFHLLRVQALEAGCRFMTAEGEVDLAIQAGLAALTAEPLRESAVDALICAHLAQGNRYEAVRCYRSFARALWRELRVRPEAGMRSRVEGLLGAAGA